MELGEEPEQINSVSVNTARKIYETSINLSAEEMYSDIDSVLMDRLKNAYEKTRWGEGLIKNILSIHKRSCCVMSKSQSDGSGTVNVQFIADTIICKPGDILPVCEIVTIDKTHRITCKYGDNIIVHIKGTKNMQALRNTQKIPVMIMGVGYGKGDKIVVEGLPFIYSNRTIFYSVSKFELYSEDKEIIKMKIAEIRSEEFLLSKLNLDVEKYIINVLYPFKTDLTGTKSDNIKYISITEFAEKCVENLVNEETKPKKHKHRSTASKGNEPEVSEKPILLCRHHTINKITDLVMETNMEGLQKEIDKKVLITNNRFEIIEELLARVLMFLLDDYLKFMVLIKEMTMAFPTEKDLTSQENVWQIYRSIKKQL